MRVISAAFRLWLRLWRALVSSALLLFYRIAFYPNFTVGKDVILQKGVRISATDGGKISIGSGTTISADSMLIAKRGQLSIGEHGFIGRHCVVVAATEITIGANALIAERVSIRDQQHGFSEDVSTPYRLRESTYAQIIIGDNVWIGAACFIAKGVTIESGVVIGANSMVNSSLQSRSLYAGNPARLIRELG
jgi:acetyltransferase-like isoleucine patch superfamily enzyme